VSTTGLYELPTKQDTVLTEEVEAEFDSLREGAALREVMFPFGGVGWVATRYDVVKDVLADPRFSVEATSDLADYPRIRQVETGPPRPPAFIQYDPPKHTTKRAVLMRHFSVKRIQQFRPRIEAIVEGCLDDIVASGSPADFAERYTQDVPVRVLSEYIGAPYEEFPLFLESAHYLGNAYAKTAEDSARAIAVVNDYFAGLADRKRTDPGDDLLSWMVNDADVAAAWTEAELRGVGFVMLSAGHSATSSILGGILEWMVNDPVVFERIRSEPERMPVFLEEFLRLLPAGLAGTRTRIALEDVQVGDVLVRKGEGVLPIVHAANFDEAVFSDADELDLDRVMSHPHVGFGHGPHACVGLQLARVEITVAIQAIVRRFASMAPADPDPDWKTKRLLRGPKRLSATWTLARV
jgi:nocardicin N-oxygenase